MRISRHQYFMQVATAVAQRSTCIDKQVGCVLVDESTGNILSTGYNGNPKGVFNCCDENCCVKNDGLPCYAVHAEINALIQRLTNVPFVAYCTLEPCIQCTAALINAGCTKVLFINETNHNKTGRGLWSRVRPEDTWIHMESSYGN